MITVSDLLFYEFKSPELAAVAEQLIRPASADEWSTWFELCDRATAAGITPPELADSATSLEIIQAWK